MPASEQVKKVLTSINEDPELLDALLQARNDNQRKRILEERGIIERGEHGPTKEEAKRQIEELIRPMRDEAGEERYAWAPSIVTAAAGAAAAFCAA